MRTFEQSVSSVLDTPFTDEHPSVSVRLVSGAPHPPSEYTRKVSEVLRFVVAAWPHHADAIIIHNTATARGANHAGRRTRSASPICPIEASE